jgi:hypothetical protein
MFVCRGRSSFRFASLEPAKVSTRGLLGGLKSRRGMAGQRLSVLPGDGLPWNPDHVSKRFKKLAALAGVPVICQHEGGRHTGNSLMQDAGVGQELGMREVGHADKSVSVAACISYSENPPKCIVFSLQSV